MPKLMTAVLSAALLLSGSPAHAVALEATVVNGGPAGATLRFDAAGEAIDAHDGEIQRFGNTYYLYGTSYGCGYEWQKAGAPFCGFRVYSSPDLEHWTNRGALFDASTPTWQGRCNGSTYGCYRPHVVYNEQTRRYVLWVNTYDVSVGYHVFTSASPTGPFVEQDVPRLTVNNDIPPGVNNGDHDVFVDRDRTAYLAFTDWRNGGEIVVEQLDPTYRTGTGNYQRVGTRSTEAPSLFRRGDLYYLTYSDPNCGYCTTGTSYLTATSPLGPWQGSGSSPDTWNVADGALTVTGGGIGLSRAGSDWTDYTVSARVTPRLAGPGTYAQAGWVFRATDAGTGYAWLLGNYPHPGATGGNLTKVVYRGGSVLSAEVVKLPFPVVTGSTYDVSTEVSGSTITTTIDGVTVDTTVDATHAAGRVGFREGAGGDQEVGTFDDVRVTAPDGSVLLSDDFSAGLGQWERPAPVVTGTKISTTSCGGQPADVAELPARGGPVYLYQSDLWNNAAPNEGLAMHHWEPLRFDAAGGISPLQCGKAYELPLSGVKPGHGPVPPPGTVTTGDLGYRPYCDVGRQVERAQTFTVTRTGSLDEVRFTTSQSGHPNAGVDLELTRLTDAGPPGEVVSEVRVQPSAVSWSPSWVTLHTSVPVTAGDRFAVVVSTTATTGCYGMAYTDEDPYAGGGAYYSSDGGQTWRAEADRDLHVRATVLSTR